PLRLLALAENATRLLGRAPDDQLSPPRCEFNRRERVVAAPLHAREHRPRERDRQQRGHDRGRRGRKKPLCLAQMLAGVRPPPRAGRAPLRPPPPPPPL